MKFEIQPNESLAGSIRAVACGQISAAMAASCPEETGPASPVHETRKRLKKARAALQLLSSEVPKHEFRRELRRLRKVGRLISGIRDAEVRLATIQQLRASADLERDRHFAQTEELLAFELDSFLAAFDGWEDEAVRKLQHAQSAIADWPLGHVTAAAICHSLRHTYRNGRRACKKARRKGTAPCFHELRKRTKQMWYQVRLLRPLANELWHEMSRELEKVSDQLGHAHDLCFVADRLHGLAGRQSRGRARRVIETLLESREEDLQRSALRVAERFYAEKPKAFAARVGFYFQQWERAQACAQIAAENDTTLCQIASLH